MPLIIPNALPAADALSQENIFTMQEQKAITQDIRPLEIGVCNLMPTKIATETQLARMLANSPLQVKLTLIQMDSHESRNVSKNHLDSFYLTLDEIRNRKFDGLIITGAPVEQLPFEKVDYWHELTELFEFSKNNVYSTVYICWGAQAGLYYHFGIKKHELDKKLVGVFEHNVVRPFNPLARGFDECFYTPHSRYTYVKKEDIEKARELRIIAESKEAGPHIISTQKGKKIFVLGHMEYDKETLYNEYMRDVKAGLNPDIPKNYFKNDDPSGDILFRWRSHANLFFHNWLNYYVYQKTPYNIMNVGNE